MNYEYARKREMQAAYVAIVFYAVTVALGIGGAVLAVYGYTWNATLMGAGSFVAAVLSFLTARASLRWRKLAEEK